jgi:hypothetical protein
MFFLLKFFNIWDKCLPYINYISKFENKFDPIIEWIKL